MHGLSLFVLTAMELTAFLILWGAFSIDLSPQNIIRLAGTAISVSLVTIATDGFIMGYSGIINYITAFLILQLLFKKPFKQSVAFYLITMALCFCVQIFIVYALRSLGRLSNDVQAFNDIFLINLLFVFASMLLACMLPAKRIRHHFERDLSTASFVVINAGLYSIILKTAWDFNKGFLWGRFFSLLSISVLLILSNLIFLKYSIKISEQKKIIETYNRYSPIIINLIEEARRKQHEFKNHLNTLYGIAQVAADSELRDGITRYIKSLNCDLMDLELLIQINNKVLSGIIYSKACQAKELGIDFSYSIKSDLSDASLEGYKLSEILNNLLDNAFDSALASESRTVILAIEEDECRHIIEVKNSGKLISPEYVSRIFDRGFSTKASDGHGYGLYNVRKIVESVKGQIQLQYDDAGYVVFRILF